jgi:PKD repeat protein
MCINDLRGLTTRAAVALLVVAGVAACSLDNQERPSLSGPSGLGLSIVMTASPDQLPRDGSSQSVVTLTARDPKGKPVGGQRLSLSMPVNAPAGAALSQTDVVTNSNGQLSFAVVAPAAGSIGNVVILATPLGTDASNATTRTISISALPANSSAPEAAFTFSPSSPEVGEVVTLDASRTRDEGVACSSCSYTWNFGGEGTATGLMVKHAFSAGGAYQVTLTVTDVGGSTSTTLQTVTVSVLTIPIGLNVTSSPAVPVAGQAATFTAISTPATNHRIVTYQIGWGDGSADSLSGSAVVQHTYTQAGQYLLTLTVRDDQAQSSTLNKVITVSAGLTAAFTTTKAGSDVTFDASGSSSQVGSTIVDYAWDFETDGTYDANGATPTTTHTYSAGTYRATLRITDSRGTTQTFAATLTVP